ncbi:transposase [Acetobacter senegalensis]|uniref:transposase n=1 Tax=Acetobacter senegalensis TaxID=446692 RepID=UPI0038D24278
MLSEGKRVQTLHFRTEIPRETIKYDKRKYKRRNRIEIMFGRLKDWRRGATRYDKTRKSFLAFLNLAAVKLWLPSFVNRT